MKSFLKCVYFVTFTANNWTYCNGAGCAVGWISYASSCYYFSPDWRTWNQSFDQCKALQSSLVEIEDSEENNFLASVYNTTIQREGACAYYIGLTDLDVEGQWTWMTSETSLEISHSHWFPGEPNNYGNVDEDCVCLTRQEPGTWNDVPCAFSVHYICERASEESTTATDITETTESTAATDGEEATVPVYMFAVVVSALLLLLVATVVFLVRKKHCQSNTNPAESYTTPVHLNPQNDREGEYDLPSIMPENSGCVGDINEKESLE